LHNETTTNKSISILRTERRNRSGASRRLRGAARRGAYFSDELGPRFLPKPTTAVTNRRLYCILLYARPRGFFFLSCFATLGVWPRTFPARANDPCTLPAHSHTKIPISTPLREEATAGEEGARGRGGGYPWLRKRRRRRRLGEAAAAVGREEETLAEGAGLYRREEFFASGVGLTGGP